MRYSDELINAFRNLYMAGVSTYEIARILKISRPTLLVWRKKLGFPARRAGYRPRNWQFCAHYDIEIVADKGDWRITEVCPYAGHRHKQSTDTGFFFDGETLGFHCFAAGCGDPSIGQVIKKLNETHEPYPELIWEEETMDEICEAFGGVDEDVLPMEYRYLLVYESKHKGRIYSNDGREWYDASGNRIAN